MLRLDAVARPGPVEPFQTAAQRKVIAELGVLALQVLDALLGLRYDPDRAKELLETGPREYDRLPDGRPYDGRPWWQA